MGDLTEHFNRAEFACKCGCGADNVRRALVDQLERLRGLMRIPIVIHSGVRCREYNKKVGGAQNSAHLTGEAADIRCIDAHTRWRIKRICYVWQMFNRIGNGDTFLHLDISTTLPQEVEWNY